MLRRQKHVLSQSTTPFACTLYNATMMNPTPGCSSRCGIHHREETCVYRYRVPEKCLRGKKTATNDFCSFFEENQRARGLKHFEKMSSSRYRYEDSISQHHSYIVVVSFCIGLITKTHREFHMRMSIQMWNSLWF